MGDKDYYKIFGLERGASHGDIKRAYRKLVKEFHPDKNSHPDASKRFCEIDEAHDVLNDPQARGEYDRRMAPASESRPHMDSDTHADQNQQNPGPVRGISPGELAASQFTPVSATDSGQEAVTGWRKRGLRRRRMIKVRWVLGCVVCMLIVIGGFFFLPCWVLPILIMLAAAFFVPRLHD